MITATSLKHPATQERILTGLIEAQDIANVKGDWGCVYVANAKGQNIMRIDVMLPGAPQLPEGGVRVYGKFAVDITDTVETALGQKFCELI